MMKLSCCCRQIADATRQWMSVVATPIARAGGCRGLLSREVIARTNLSGLRRGFILLLQRQGKPDVMFLHQLPEGAAMLPRGACSFCDIAVVLD